MQPLVKLVVDVLNGYCLDGEAWATLTDEKELANCLTDLGHVRKAAFGSSTQVVDVRKLAACQPTNDRDPDYAVHIHHAEHGTWSKFRVPRKLDALAMDILIAQIANLAD